MPERNKPKSPKRVQQGRRKRVSQTVPISEERLPRTVASDLDEMLRAANVSTIRISGTEADGKRFRISYYHLKGIPCYIRVIHDFNRRRKLEQS